MSARKTGIPREVSKTYTRQRIMDAALHRFSRSGFQTRLEDIAAEAGLTRGGLLRHFPSKDDLFFEVHRAAALSLKPYLDAPEDVLSRGFFETLRYYLLDSERFVREEYEPYRLVLLGKYATDFNLQERITRFWLSEDPERTVDFVEFGQRRGEIRQDLDPLLVAAVLDWIVEGFVRSVAARELDRARLFHRTDGGSSDRLERAADTVIVMLCGILSSADHLPRSSDPERPRPRANHRREDEQARRDAPRVGTGS